MTLQGQLVARVHLHGKVVAGIDKLDEEREALTKTLHDATTDQVGAVSANQFAERNALLRAVGYDRRAIFYIRHFPALANLARIRGQVFEGANGSAAPKHFFQNRVE